MEVDSDKSNDIGHIMGCFTLNIKSHQVPILLGYPVNISSHIMLGEVLDDSHFDINHHCLHMQAVRFEACGHDTE